MVAAVAIRLCLRTGGYTHCIDKWLKSNSSPHKFASFPLVRRFELNGVLSTRRHAKFVRIRFQTAYEFVLIGWNVSSERPPMVMPSWSCFLITLIQMTWHIAFEQDYFRRWRGRRNFHWTTRVGRNNYPSCTLTDTLSLGINARNAAFTSIRCM